MTGPELFVITEFDCTLFWASRARFKSFNGLVWPAGRMPCMHELECELTLTGQTWCYFRLAQRQWTGSRRICEGPEVGPTSADSFERVWKWKNLVKVNFTTERRLQNWRVFKLNHFQQKIYLKTFFLKWWFRIWWGKSDSKDESKSLKHNSMVLSFSISNVRLPYSRGSQTFFACDPKTCLKILRPSWNLTTL